MDKNTIIGLILIGALLFGWSYFMTPSKEEIREIQIRDSLTRVEKAQEAELRRLKEAEQQDYSSPIKEQALTVSTLFNQNELTADEFTIENNKIKLTINGKGGRITSVNLKDYVTNDTKPLNLWDEKHSTMGMRFYANNLDINTENLIFVPSSTKKSFVAERSDQTLSLRTYVDEDKYLEYVYSLSPDSYNVNFKINVHNLNNIIASNARFLTLYWGATMPQQEKSKDFENRYTGVYYRFAEDDVDHLSVTGNEELDLPNKVKWIAFKQQFFSSILVADENFTDNADDNFTSVKVSSAVSEESGFLKSVFAEISLPYSGDPEENYNMRFFFGPNDFRLLQEYGKDLDFPDLVNMGWKWISWINKFIVIPVFHFLEGNVTRNYGLIIFLLTLVLKIFLFPLTYKSFMSQAKMKVLRPQIEEINKKIPAEKSMERQQATMNLYKRAGVNPMGGCLPMLLQFPILIAFFNFFPGAIELRQQGFLWADDLASYDSILDLSFKIPFYGDHVSLFCILMAVTNLIYTVMNQKNQPQNDQMKSMKYMMYFMPIMFLFIFNNYSAGLSYYFFISTLITMLQTWSMRFFINDEKLLKEMEKAKAKPIKKSKFQQRLEQMQKEQEKQMRQRKR